LPVGEGIGATQAECMVISPTRAAAMLPIVTVPDAFETIPGPPGEHPAKVHGAV